MSSKENRDPIKELDAVYDALADSITHAKDEELLEEAKLFGQDPKQLAADVKTTLLKSLTAFKQRRLIEARREYDESADSIKVGALAKLPQSPEERRSLLSWVFSQRPAMQAMLTTQHREFTDLSDDDVASYLEELGQLGVLDELKGNG